MGDSAYDRALEWARQNGSKINRANRGVLVQCPSPRHAHGDRRPSLHLSDQGGRLGVHCYAGCDTLADVLPAMGWQPRDLHDEPRTTYNYADGATVERSTAADGSKVFRQSGHRSERQTVLYRLDRLDGTDTVYLVEGEADVHAAESAGLTATTTRMGAANVDKADLTPLHGRHVVAVVDRDEAGNRWAASVRRMLGTACTLEFRQAAIGKDLSDHLAAGLGVEDLCLHEAPRQVCADVQVEAQADGENDAPGRRVVLVAAADIKPRRVRWLWQGRLALGTLGLLAGREGLGKSSLAYSLAAQISRGTLPGEFVEQPRAVLVCATEDSWTHTIVPRLMAADADLTKVFQVEVVSADGITVGLSLPRDLHEMEQAAKDTGAALLLLDPLMSRLSEQLDSHKDGEVRRALEPLVAIADRTDMAVLGLIHHNKSGSADPLRLVMGSKAFTAVARSVHTVVLDPDDDTETRRLFGTPKNNVGTTDLPTLVFTMTGHPVETDDGTAWTGKVVWGAPITATIGEAMRRSAESQDDRSATSEAVGWLDDYLSASGGTASSVDIKRAGAAAGHSLDALKRARRRLGLGVNSSGFPRHTSWYFASETPSKTTSPQSRDSQSRDHSRGDPPLHQLHSLGRPSSPGTSRSSGCSRRRPHGRRLPLPRHAQLYRCRSFPPARSASDR